MSKCFECLDCGEVWKTQFAPGDVCPNCGEYEGIIDPFKDQMNLFEQKNERIVKALNDNWAQVFYALKAVSQHDIDVDVRADAVTALKEIREALNA